MKNMAIISALVLSSSLALAQSVSSTNTATTAVDSKASNEGNNQNITFQTESGGRTEINYSGSQTIRNVPSVSGPPLISSNDTCMGSLSGSVNIPGFGGSLGKTYTDANCVMLKNSRELWNMGMKAASLALMCKDPDNREALEITGFTCPQTLRDKEAALAKAKLDNETYKDPFIRARMGLPPLE